MSKKILFCFPCAGGTKDFFNLLNTGDVEIVIFDYPGHESKKISELPSSIHEMAIVFSRQIREIVFAEKADLEYALFGYSMGCLVATDVLSIVLDEKIPKPKHVFLGAHTPSTMIDLNDNEYKNNSDEYVKQRTIKFGSVPQKLVKSDTFWRLYLPVFKADYKMIANFDFNNLHLKTDIPTTIFYSEEDTKLSEMSGWGEYYLNCNFYKFIGNHFFIREWHNDISRIIRNAFGGGKYEI